MKVEVGNGSEGRLQTWIAAPVNRLWWVEEVLVVLVVVVVVVVVQRAPAIRRSIISPSTRSTPLGLPLGHNYDGSRT